MLVFQERERKRKGKIWWMRNALWSTQKATAGRPHVGKTHGNLAANCITRNRRRQIPSCDLVTTGSIIISARKSFKKVSFSVATFFSCFFTVSTWRKRRQGWKGRREELRCTNDCELRTLPYALSAYRSPPKSRSANERQIVQLNFK